MVLLEHSTPLLTDQPENNLNNQFIFDQVVTALRREKKQRHFLRTTHNANILVPGDAELILVFEIGVNKDDQQQHGGLPKGAGKRSTLAKKSTTK